MSFSFNPPFIQGRVNADSVPGFVREASVLALGFSTQWWELGGQGLGWEGVSQPCGVLLGLKGWGSLA